MGPPPNGGPILLPETRNQDYRKEFRPHAGERGHGDATVRSCAMSSRALRHALVLLVFAALTIAWTWPLLPHVRDALPGAPGDNYSFVWNLWWMRRVLSTPGLAYLRTDYLFYPFGTTIADHPHAALPAFVAATLLRSESPAAAQNTLLLVYVFANLASMYALAWSITSRHVPSALAGVVFGISPYIA